MKMKYLKLYESYKSNLFFEIDLGSFNQCNERIVDFDHKMVLEITQMLKSNQFETINYYGNKVGTRQIEASKPQSQFIRNNFNEFAKIELQIFYIQDEWFLVRVRQWGKGDLDTHYKCDQLEGLQELINQL